MTWIFYSFFCRTECLVWQLAELHTTQESPSRTWNIACELDSLLRTTYRAPLWPAASSERSMVIISLEIRLMWIQELKIRRGVSETNEGLKGMGKRGKSLTLKHSSALLSNVRSIFTCFKYITYVLCNIIHRQVNWITKCCCSVIR